MFENAEDFGFYTILSNVDWREETWLIALLFMHLLTTISILTFIRNYTTIQIILFFLLLGAAYFSETINYYAAKNWFLFSTKQYFDSYGLFLSVVFSIPILLNTILLIGLWLYNSRDLISKLKVAQYKQKQRLKEAQKRDIFN